MRRELRLNVASNGACLNACHPVCRVDPENAIEAAHVHGHDHAPFVGRTAERVGDVGSPAVRNEASVMPTSGFHQRRHRLFRCRKDHQVRHPRHASVLDGVHRLQRVAMAVPQAKRRIGADGVVGKACTNGLYERGILHRGRHCGGIGRHVKVVRRNVHAEYLPDPRKEAGKLGTAQGVAGARERDAAIGEHREAGVAKAPDVQADLGIILGTGRLGVDQG